VVTFVDDWNHSGACRFQEGNVVLHDVGGFACEPGVLGIRRQERLSEHTNNWLLGEVGEAVSRVGPGNFRLQELLSEAKRKEGGDRCDFH